MAIGKRFDYYYDEGPVGDIVYWWDDESPVEDVPIDITKVMANFGEITGGYSISTDTCTDMYFYFGDTDPPPLVASFEGGFYTASIEYEIPANLDSNTRYYLKAIFEGCETYGGDITYTGHLDTESILPGKPTNPSPIDDATGITLDETPLSWDASDPAADTYEIYFREQGDDWVRVGDAQAAIEWAIASGTLGYSTTYEWRIDATNAYGTTTGDTWTFSAISFYPPLPSGVTLDANGNPTGTPTGVNFIATIKKLIVAANNKIWYEDI